MVHKRTINNKGFSLVEVIIAMAILAIISIPLLSYFTESMRYNAQAKTRQQATLTAQSVMEQLKLEDKLLDLDSASGKYLTPYFGSVTPGDANYHIDDATGIGDVVYQCPAGTLSSQFDVKVTLSAASAHNTTELPVIYGFDETKDILAVEKEQLSEAVVYFQASNASYGGTDTVEQIKARTTRTMYLEFGMSGTDYNVKVYYEYVCKNSMTGTDEHYMSVPLVDVKIATLENMYVLFNRRQDNEQVIIKNDSHITLPHIYFIGQEVAAGTSYASVMTISGLTHLEKNAYIIHTDFASVYDDTLSPDAIKRSALTTTEKPIRMVNIKVGVYKAGSMGDASVEPLAEMQSTKGE